MTHIEFMSEVLDISRVDSDCVEIFVLFVLYKGIT